MNSRLKHLLDFLSTTSGVVTAEDVSKYFNISIQSARKKLEYLYKTGLISRRRENKKFIYTVDDLDMDLATYNKPFTVRKKETKTGVIVQFGDKWRPERAIRSTRPTFAGKSSLMHDE